MHVTVTRKGGFAGFNDTLCSRDVSDRPELKKSAEQLLSRASSAVAPAGADFVRYEVTVEDGGERRAVSFVDDGSALSQSLKQLVAQLTS